MGYKLSRFNFTSGENEQIDAVIKVCKELRSAIHGVVVDEHNKPIKDAVVKLLKMKCHENPHELEPITHAFTDDCGQFLFGPLCPHTHYIVKVWVNHVKTKEIVISSEQCEHNHSDRNHCECSEMD